MSDSPKHYHFVGVSGTAMGSVAAALIEQGYTVTGSDTAAYPPMSTFLEERGINIIEGYAAKNIPESADVIVVGNAISRGNLEVEAVLERKLHYLSLPQVMREKFLRGKHNLVVSGTHGKTTTASMLAWLLQSAGKEPDFMIGGIPRNFGQGARFSDAQHVVLEGDEYDSAFFDKRSKFVHYLPEVLIINNIEFDHADIFENLEAIKLSFKRLINLVPSNGLILLNGDCPNSMAILDELRQEEKLFAPAQTVGTSTSCDLQIADLRESAEGCSFTIGEEDYQLPMSGEFNVRNAAMALSAAKFSGLDQQEIQKGLNSFEGIARRQEVRGEVNGIRVIDDFGHHPTAIAATLTGLRKTYAGERLWAVFEPRSNTSRRNTHQEELIEALKLADGAVIAEVSDAHKIPEAERLNVLTVAEEVAKSGVPTATFEKVDAIINHLLPLLQEGDNVIVFSNGGFDGIHQKLLSALETATV